MEPSQPHPHRDVTAPSAFLVLSTANGTELTLSGTHIIYVSEGSFAARVPVAARHVKVWEAVQ